VTKKGVLNTHCTFQTIKSTAHRFVWTLTLPSLSLFTQGQSRFRLERPFVLFLQLKYALQEVLAQPGAVKPERVRFFRGQMQTIITRALNDLDIKPIPSRRCFTLIGMTWCPDATQFGEVEYSPPSQPLRQSYSDASMADAPTPVSQSVGQSVSQSVSQSVIFRHQ
jgi:RNA-binding protein Tab2/Atab2